MNGLKNQSGFTLIELMIAIVLGLLISAAALQILFTSQRSIINQQAGSEIQIDGIFGVGSLDKSIRMANFGARGAGTKSPYYIYDRSLQGGIVFNTTDNLRGFSPVSPAALTLANANESNLDGKKSDQLVLQTKAFRNTFDCLGNAVNEGQYIVERYFLREDTATTKPGEPKALGLACDAAVYNFDPTLATTTSLEFKDKKSFDGKGEIILSRVDHFSVLLGVNTNDNPTVDPTRNTFQYMNINDYVALRAPGVNVPRVMAIKYAIVTRSPNPISAGQTSAQQSFNIFGEDNLKLKSSVAQDGNYQRQLYTSTVLIRNARGS